MRKLLISLAVIATVNVVAAAYSDVQHRQANVSGKRRSTVIGDGRWTARMGWRYVSYIEGDASISFQIEPMVKGADRVYVPSESSWLRTAPEWVRPRRAEILSRLKLVKWNRRLEWPESDKSSVGNYSSDTPIPGSLESTPGGRALENMRMFEPGSKVTHAQAHRIWHDAARAVVELATGTVTIFMSGVVPGSVFQEIELPALKRNPNVTIVFK